MRELKDNTCVTPEACWTPESWSAIFTQRGTYTYDCAVHGLLMTGQIVVR